MGPLSLDLRKRVISAVTEDGMSCRAAARRFGVSFASAIRWMASLRERGDYAPLRMGGDQRSGRVEAHADYLLGLVRREPDLTLAEIRDRLERAPGHDALERQPLLADRARQGLSGHRVAQARVDLDVSVVC